MTIYYTCPICAGPLTFRINDDHAVCVTKTCLAYMAWKDVGWMRKTSEVRPFLFGKELAEYLASQNDPLETKTSPYRFTHAQWQTLLDASIAQINSLSKLKGGEYAGDSDRLANFRRNGAALGLPMETIWAVYAAKHWDAIQQWIVDQRLGTTRERLEPISGRIDDLLVYLLLLKAMVQESGQ